MSNLKPTPIEIKIVEEEECKFRRLKMKAANFKLTGDLESARKAQLDAEHQYNKARTTRALFFGE